MHNLIQDFKPQKSSINTEFVSIRKILLLLVAQLVTNLHYNINNISARLSINIAQAVIEKN